MELGRYTTIGNNVSLDEVSLFKILLDTGKSSKPAERTQAFQLKLDKYTSSFRVCYLD